MTGTSRIPGRWAWLFPVLLTAMFANMMVWPTTTVEAKPLSAVREFSVTLKAPDLIVPNVFHITLGDTIRFNVKNEGPAPHNLHIGGNGVDVESPTWPSGGTAVWEHTFLRAGVYSLYCTVSARGFEPLQHRHVGPMEGVIVVTNPGQTMMGTSRFETRAMRVDAQGSSGVSGNAFLQQSADGSVRVRVQATGLRPGATYQAGLFDLNSISCSGGMVGNLSAPWMASSASGMLLFTASGPIESVGAVAIREGGNLVACGNTSSLVTGVGNMPAAMGTARPSTLPRTGEADIPVTALWLMGFGILLTGSAFTLRRRQRA